MENRPNWLSKTLSLLAISLSGIENLSLRVSDDTQQVSYTGPDWSFVRGSFPMLQWLRVDRYIASQLLRQQWNMDQDVLAPSVTHIILIGVEWKPSPPDALEYERRKQCLYRLLQTEDDGPYGQLRSVAVGGSAGGTHHAIVDDMPAIPFMVFQGAAKDGGVGPENRLSEMYL